MRSKAEETFVIVESLRLFYKILKKKEEKSHDMQKLTPNHSKLDCDVTSTIFDLVKLRH